MSTLHSDHAQIDATGRFRSIGSIVELARNALKIGRNRPTGPAAYRDEIAKDVERVRELALVYLRTDPGIAADLFAAAKRSEQRYLKLN